ncbi:MAG: hypothetical protein JSW17_01545, partial [Candidatus Omnitrophota bacterium]
ILTNINLDIIDLNRFRNMKLGTLQILEDRDYGDSIYIDPGQNNISINMNWEKWPMSEVRTLTQAEVPSDQELISIADSFIREYGINMDMYGPGEVVSREVMIAAEEVSEAYIPENYSVVYPLMLDGKTASDQSGRKAGISVEVNIRHKKVVYTGNISISGFESSKYNIETDEEKIIATAEKGGIYRFYDYPDATETIELELGTPTLQLVRIWQRSQTKVGGEEMYVPSFVFPIIGGRSQDYFYRQNVIVPLVGEMYTDSVEPMPLLEGK